MGIILSALAAAGDEGVRSLDSNIKQIHLQELEAQRSDLEMQKAKAVAQFNLDAADVQRRDRAARMALTPVEVQGIIAGNRTTADAAQAKLQTSLSVANPEAELLPSIDPARYQPTQDQLDRAVVRKAVDAGDISALETLKMDQQDKQNLYLARLAANKERREDIREAQVDAFTQRTDANAVNYADRTAATAEASAARTDALIQKLATAGGGNPTKDALQLLSQTRLAISQDSTNLLKVYQVAVDATFKPEERARLKTDFDVQQARLTLERAQVTADINTMRGKMGLGVEAAAPPVAPPVSPPVAPPVAEVPGWTITPSKKGK